MPSSGDTIRKWILDAFLSARTDLIHEFQQSDNVVHFSFDLWTSPNGMAICGVIGHFIGPQNKLTNLLLALRKMLGAHSGEDIVEVLVDVLE